MNDIIAQDGSPQWTYILAHAAKLGELSYAFFLSSAHTGFAFQPCSTAVCACLATTISTMGAWLEDVHWFAE